MLSEKLYIHKVQWEARYPHYFLYLSFGSDMKQITLHSYHLRVIILSSCYSNIFIPILTLVSHYKILCDGCSSKFCRWHFNLFNISFQFGVWYNLKSLLNKRFKRLSLLKLFIICKTLTTCLQSVYKQSRHESHLSHIILGFLKR